LHPNNIELAFRQIDEERETKRSYESLGGMGNMTIDDLIKKGHWK